MLSKEVMIEDWVFAPNNNKNKPSKPKKVLAIDFTTNHILVYNPKTEETTYADLADCGPIPLTKKILELNEFSGNRIMEYRFEENHETYNLYLKEMYNREGIQDSWGYQCRRSASVGNKLCSRGSAPTQACRIKQISRQFQNLKNM